MNNLIQKIAREWLASKVIQASIHVKQRGGSWAARSDKDFDVKMGMNKYVLTAEHARGTWGHHTYRLVLEGKPIGWLSKNSVMTRGSDGEMDHDYYEYTISDAKKRVLVDRAEGIIEKAIEKALDKMDRNGDLERAGIRANAPRLAYGGWVTKTLQGIDHDDERGTSSSQVRQAITRIEQKLIKEFDTWNVKATIDITNDFRQPSKRVEFGYVDYDLTGQFWLPPDMDATEFVGLVETVLGVHRVSLRDLKKGPGGSWIYKQEMYQGTRSTF